MSRQSRNARRRCAVVGVTAIAALAGASSAHAAKLTLTYSCAYPLIGAQPLTLDIEAALPASGGEGDVLSSTRVSIQVKSVATAGGNTHAGFGVIGATSLEAWARLEATVMPSGGFNLPITIPLRFDSYTVPTTSGDLVLSASGSTPSIMLPSGGQASIAMGSSLRLNLIARDAAGTAIRMPAVGADSDGDPATFDVNCVLSPAGQNTLLTPLFLPPPAPGKPTFSAITSTSATATWAASTLPDPEARIASYDVYVDGVLKTTVATNSAVLTGLQQARTYSVTVIARDGSGTGSARSVAGELTTTLTPPPTAPGQPTFSDIAGNSATASWGASTVSEGTIAAYEVFADGILQTTVTGTTATLTGLTPGRTYSITVIARGDSWAVSVPSAAGSLTAAPPAPVAYGYSLAGSATLKTLVKGTLPLTGSINAELELASGNFTADLGLNPTSAKLTALGFLPVVAKVNMVSTAPVTGKLAGGVLTANAKVRIKLPSVTLLGIPLAGGSTCQAKTPSNINLKSTDAFFAPLSGGNLAGTFAISDLVGCGFLTGIVSPLTAGGGNAIALRLTPLPTQLPTPLATVVSQ